MIKISSLELEYLKRVKIVQFEPSKDGLTIIGGKNGQGKTSVLDGIMWALGGDKYRPSNPIHEGSVIPPKLTVTLSNGITVTRSGKNSSLKVVDPTGQRAGQQLLNSFIDELALNLPKFLEMSNKDKANTLLEIIGVGEELYKLDTEIQTLYNQRHAIGQIADQKSKYAKEMPVYTDCPKEPISASDLIKRQQEILAKNGRNQELRRNASALAEENERLNSEIARLQEQLSKLIVRQGEVNSDMLEAQKTASQLQDESTAEIEASINDIESINAKVRANLEREKAELDAENYKKQYDELTNRIDNIRQSRIDLLNGAELPLEGLSVQDGELTYNNYKWDCMSASEQLKVATAIVRKLKPECGFVLLDKLEQMDIDTLNEFGEWLKTEGLQVIATRVSTGDECSIIIEDGYAVKTEETKPKWKAGAF